MPNLLFIYGTLKVGKSNHHRLAGQRFVRTVRTKPIYRLIRISWYPGLVPAENGVAVEGELWEVDDEALSRLDEFEGVPTLFERCRIEVEEVEGPLEAYLYRGSIMGKEDCGTCWTENR